MTKKYLSIASFTAAIIFALIGMWMPPQGEIDGSVLILVAQFLVLCATFLGIKDYTNLISRRGGGVKVPKLSFQGLP